MTEKTKHPDPLPIPFSAQEQLLIMSPETLFNLYGIRFHHFLLKKTGQIAGTVASLPSQASDESCAVAVAPLRGKDGDTPTRWGGRREALKRLLAQAQDAKTLKLPREVPPENFNEAGLKDFPKLGDAVWMPTALLKKSIEERTILQLLLGDSARSAKSLRPKAPFKAPKLKAVQVDPFEVPLPERMEFESDQLSPFQGEIVGGEES